MVKGTTEVLPSQIRKMGTYLVANIQEGLVLMWDQKTSLFVKISPIFQVCPLTWQKKNAEFNRPFFHLHHSHVYYCIVSFKPSVMLSSPMNFLNAHLWKHRT